MNMTSDGRIIRNEGPRIIDIVDDHGVFDNRNNRRQWYLDRGRDIGRWVDRKTPQPEISPDSPNKG